ncbi:protein Daple-like isoform X3 [Ictalurus furcatus]|uniref:protein Daple-like isoform X3 n=1 Tax=Ictalurus furcatus TaxID=66913 RepID=UPI0023501E4A|nr:protein Daple-like isoform X3 [Ictalurus furcatus]
MNIFCAKMSDDNLSEQLKQFISSHGGGVVVNCESVYSMMYSMHSRLERLEAERKTADVRKADVGESQPDEKSSSHTDEQKAAQEQLSSGTEMPSLSTSDTSGQVEDSEEGVSKSLMQDLVKENQEVKKEVETLKNQFSQCVTLEHVQVLLSQQGPLVSVSDGALNQLAGQTQSQQSSLLHSILCRLECLEAKRETADGRKADVDRDVSESQPDEKSSTRIDEQKAALEQLSGGTEMPSLSTSDTSGQVEDSEEGVSKSLMQDMVKENQELKKKMYSLKKEVETLKNQFSQCVTLEHVQVLLSQQGPLVSVSDGALNQLAGQTQSQQSSLLHSILCRLERLEAERETADGRKADIDRDVGESQPDEKSSTRLDEQKAALEQLSGGTEMPSLSTSDTNGQVEDSEEGVSKSLMQDLVKENQELKKKMYSLKKEVETLKNQLSQNINTVQSHNSNKMKQFILFFQCVTLEHVQVLLSQQGPLVSVSEGALNQLAGQTQSQVSSEVEQVPETLEALTDHGGLQEKHESLEAPVERLEGEQDDTLDQLNQLKTQLVDAVTVDRKKVYEVEPLHMGPVNMSESSGLGEELAMSEATDSQSRDSFSGLEQQLHLQTADIRNAVQKLDMEVRNMKQELLTIRLEQKRSPYNEMQDKLDSLQSKLDSLMASSSSMLSWSLQQEDLDSPAGQEGAAEPAWLSGMAALSMKISELFHQVENLQSIVTDLMKQETSGRTFITDTTSELTSDVQGPILQLQAGHEKLHSTASPLREHRIKEQSHIETTQLTSDVQGTVLQLQAGREKLHSTASPLREHRMKEQSHIETTELSDVQGTVLQLQAGREKLHSTASPLREHRMKEQSHIETTELSDVQGTVLQLQAGREKLHSTASPLREHRMKEQSHIETTELTSDVQGSVLQLQAGREKLHSTASLLREDHTQEQSHIEHLYKTMKELDEKKADKKAVKIVKSIKADMQALDTKVLLCDTKTVMLNRTFQDLLTGLEDYCHKVFEKIFRELDCKLNYTELDLLKKQLELDCQMRIHKELQLQRAPESDDAAGLKKQLTKFSCLSCGRCVEMNTPGPRLLVLPELPSLLSPKDHRRLRTCTNLDQYKQSPTEWSMEQTMIFRVSDGCGFDGHIYKTSEVRVPTVSPKEGYCKKKEMVNRSQLLTPSGRKPVRLLPLRPQQPQTQLICHGSNCLEKDKQWFIEDSIPQTLQCSQPRKPDGNND